MGVRTINWKLTEVNQTDEIYNISILLKITHKGLCFVIAGSL